MAEPSPENPPHTTVPDVAGDTFGFLDRSIVPRGETPRPVAAPSGAPAYVLREMIGQGGQADVWEAWQTSLHRLVALKIHRRGLRDAFVREALLTGELDHPNIVPVLDIDESSARGHTRLAMAMKRIRGRRWDDLIAEDLATAPGEGMLRRHLDILQSVCRAVSYAHSRGIVHLDLKPGQVMVGEFGEVYLMDWGVAARLEAGADLPARHVAEIAAPAGTPAYMAPEQALGDGASIGVATDVYLLGALAHHIASGRAPHGGDSTERILEAARRNEVAPLPPDVPEGLRRIVARATSLLPRDRHATAEEFRRDIEEFLATARQTAEARQLAASVALERGRLATMDYPALTRLEQLLDRAEALEPGNAETEALRDNVIAAHHARAVRGGDLELAWIVAGKLRDGHRRDEALKQVADAEARVRQRETQRRRARRMSIAALSCAVVVLLGSSYALRKSLATASAERARAEDALVQSRRELARASVQAALSHLDHQRDAEARDALRHAPVEFRGWEWNYLANAAMPEARLLRPRGERYSALAASEDGTLLAAIREGDAALVLLDPDVHEGAAPLRVEERQWNAVAKAPGGGILAGSSDGVVALLDRDGEGREWRIESRAIVAVASPGGGEAIAADDEGRVLRLLADGATTLLVETGDKVAALSARGEALAIGTEGGAIWHAKGRGAPPTKSTFVHSAPVLGFAWHPTLDLVASWAVAGGATQPLEDGRAAVHRLGQPAPVFVRESDGLAITAVAWSPAGDRLYLASANTTILEHDAATWKRLRTLLHPQGIVRGMEFAADGAHLATFTWRAAEIRSMADNVVPRSVRADSRMIAGRALRERDMILCGSDGGIGLWRTDRAEHERNFQIHRERGLSLDIDADGRLLASGHQTGKVMLWSAVDPDRATARELWFDRAIDRVRLSADGALLVAHEDGGKLHVISAPGATDEQRVVREVGENLLAVAISPDARRIVAAPEGGGLLLADAASDSEPSRVGDPARRWTALEFVGDALVAAAAQDGAIALLDAESLAMRRELAGHDGAVRRLRAADGGRLLLSASQDETARLWEVEGGRCLAVYSGTHAAAVTSAALTPDGRRVLTSCMDSVVRVFDRESAVELLALEEHQYGILDMVLSPDGLRLFTSGQDSRLRAWFALPDGVPDAAFDAGVAAHRAR